MFGLFGKKKQAEADRLQKIQLASQNSERMTECNITIDFFLHFLGYIAREVITRQELARLIEGGITPQALQDTIFNRIEREDALHLGTQLLMDRPFPVKLTQNYRDRHVYIIGRSGSGKTNLLRLMVLQDIGHGNGVGILAPEQELLTDEILPYIPPQRIKDVIYVNPADTEYPIAINPLHLDEGEDIDLKVDELLTIFGRIMGDLTPRMGEILRQSFYALMERRGSTLLDLDPLLDRRDAGLRNQIIKQSRDPQTVRFFRDVYPSYPKEASLPITTRIGRLVRPRLVRTLLCQPGKSLNFREAMDAGKILLFNLSDGILGEQTAQLLGQLIVSKIQMAVMSRADTPAARRRPFYLYLDEFQTFTGVAGASYEKILSRARKYRLGLILAHQQTGQLSIELLKEILGNVSTIVSFNVSSSDASRFSKEFIIEDFVGEKSELPPYELLDLKTGEAYIKIGRQSFFMQTHLIPNRPNAALVDEIIQASRLNYGAKISRREEPPQDPPPRDNQSNDDDDDLDPSKVF